MTKAPKQSSSERWLAPFYRLVGTWSTEATHPAVPGVVVRGASVFEFLEGERFLIQRARADHPDFPDSIAIIGCTEQDLADEGSGTEAASDGDPLLTMHYFDSRGVFRLFEVAMDNDAWRVWRRAPGFSQRFTGTLTDGGDTVAGIWELCRDDVHWADDLKITYRRRR